MMIGSSSNRHRLFLAGLLLFISFVLIGCDSGGKDKAATVEGKVSVDGSPASSGNVVFTTSDGKSVSGAIDAEGSYHVLDVPLGSVQVAVQPPPSVPVSAPAPDLPGTGGSSKPLKVARKYTDPKTSGLSTTIKGGKNKYDIQVSAQ